VRGSFHAFATFDQLSQSLADGISNDLDTAVDARGRASLVVPGGTTPGAFFDVLRDKPVRWSKVTVTLTDERWVAKDSEFSNERLVRTRLLMRAPQSRFVSLKTDQLRASDAQVAVNARILEISRPFDVVLAGMGDDGHTASWIPGAVGLAESLDETSPSLVHAIEAPAGSVVGERVTLTLRALLGARLIYILLRGDRKREAYEKALKGRDVFAMPIRALIFQDRVPVEFFWAAD
jgi:6-phosphogluconolactonase